jgi:hypothetical protein
MPGKGLPVPSDRPDDGYEMFTLRVNIERPTRNPPGAAHSGTGGRLKIHVRHVNSGRETTRFSLDEALDWLRVTIAALFHKSGGPSRPSGSSDSAQQ